jgi:hypothetical protein
MGICPTHDTVGGMARGTWAVPRAALVPGARFEGLWFRPTSGLHIRGQTAARQFGNHEPLESCPS